MKVHTSGYKDNVKLFGREIDSIITYEDNGEMIELGAEELNSVTPHYEASILKSVMKELDIDSNVDIPLETQINYQFGVKVNDTYEYINFGNYIVYSSEKQEDLGSYKIKCYDKMLYAMKDYDEVATIYPLSVREYIYELCDTIGLTFKNVNETFTNYNRTISSDLYKGLGYTYRDVLDELAQVTGSTICINDDDELEIRYITSTNDTIDEEYLKDVNVNFGAKYGPVNSIVLSRGAESDNVYLQNTTSIEQNGLCEIKIKDNQIMNFNDRSDYLPGLLDRLDGLEYYLNDFSSTGITYYDLCDRYNISIDNTTYSCVMFNDEVLVTQGLEENIHTDMPEETETDYTKADKTDRKINQTYLLVDKQNQVIEGVVSQVSDQNEQIATIRLQYNELLSRISDIADITTSAEDTDARVHLDNVNTSQPIDVKIHPIAENICYLYPYSGLYPSSALFIKSRKLRFENTETNEVFDWVLPTDLWYLNSTTYDELELSYGDGTNSNVIVTRRCTIDANGNITALATPTTERYPYPDDVILTDGDYDVYLVDNTTGYLYVQLMAKNIYTTQFYTKAETNTLVNQTATDITLGVNQTLSNYSTTTEMNTAITLKATEINNVVSQKVGNNEVISSINNAINNGQGVINLKSNSVIIDSDNFKLTKEGDMTANSGTFGGEINTSEDCIVGNNLYVGQNQATSYIDNKYIKFSNTSYIQRNLVNGSEVMEIHGDGVGIITDQEFYLGTFGNQNIIIGENFDEYNTGHPFIYLMATSAGQYIDITDTSIEASTNITISSDERLKDKIKDIDTSFIDDLKVKEFEYKRTPGKKQIGLIAQDYVDKDYSEYFLEQNKDGYYGISYGNITNALIKYCQDLKKEVNELKEEINKLKGGNK